MSIKQLLYIPLVLLTLFACNDQRKNVENIEQCVRGWGYYQNKIQLVEKAIQSIGKIEDYIVVKQGSDSSGGYSYWFILVGLQGDKGIVLNMSDKIKTPIIEPVNFDLAKELIDLGNQASIESESMELSLEVNNTPCHFIYYQNNKNSSEIAFSGLIPIMSLTDKFIKKLEWISSEVEDGVELDERDPMKGMQKEDLDRFRESIGRDFFKELHRS